MDGILTSHYEFPRIPECRPSLGDIPSSLSAFYILSGDKQALKTPSMRLSSPSSVLDDTSFKEHQCFPAGLVVLPVPG